MLLLSMHCKDDVHDTRLVRSSAVYPQIDELSDCNSISFNLKVSIIRVMIKLTYEISVVINTKSKHKLY